MIHLLGAAACAAIVYAIVGTRLFAWADLPPSTKPRRLSTIDGLRGVLALAVVFYHASLMRHLVQTGVWNTPWRVAGLLGPSGVSVFFMITGYLFFSTLLRENGRPDWLSLYVGRVFRIWPAYAVAIVGMMVAVLVRDHFAVSGSTRSFLADAVAWLFGAGAQPSSLPFAGDRHAYTAVCGVTWSLRYEWGFYAVLPLLAPLVRLRFRTSNVPALALLACLVWARCWPVRDFPPALPIAFSLFLVGMLCASLREVRIPRVPDAIASVAVLVALALIFTLFRNAYTIGPLLLLGTIFFLVARGCTVFGFLTSRPAKRVGDVSYPLYLMHGLVLNTVRLEGPVAGWFGRSAVGFLVVTLGVAVVAVAASTVVHVFVERPGIAEGRSAASWLKRRLRISVAADA